MREKSKTKKIHKMSREKIQKIHLQIPKYFGNMFPAASGWMNLVDFISMSLLIVIKMSLFEGGLPQNWKTAHMSFLHVHNICQATSGIRTSTSS